jgi:hypothetical protein
VIRAPRHFFWRGLKTKGYLIVDLALTDKCKIGTINLQGKGIRTKNETEEAKLVAREGDMRTGGYIIYLYINHLEDDLLVRVTPIKHHSARHVFH